MATAALDSYYLYRKTESPGRVALSSPTQPGLIGNLDGGRTGALSIGFTFNFNNTDYTTFSVTTDGMMGLGHDTPVDFQNNLTKDNDRVLLCPWWDDLQAVGNLIRYELQGTAPNRSLVVDWDAQHYNDTIPNLEFQVILYETTNRIEFRYDTIVLETATGANASVGVKVDTRLSGEGAPGTANGNFRDFIGASGVNESNANGGWNTVVTGPPAIPNNNLDASSGEDYPGDSTNSTSLGQYYFLFSPDEEGAGGGGGGSFANGQSTPTGKRYSATFTDNQMSQLVTQYDRGANQENYVPFRLSVRGPSNLRFRPAGKVYKVTKT